MLPFYGTYCLLRMAIRYCQKRNATDTLRNGESILLCCYVTTVSDYSLNNAEYLKHVTALTWYNTSALSKSNLRNSNFSELTFQNKLVSFSLSKEQQVRLDAINLKGQVVGRLYLREPPYNKRNFMSVFLKRKRENPYKIKK